MRSMKGWWGIPYGVLIGLIVGGIIYLVAGKPRGEPITLLPPPTSLPLVVQVSGAVNNPGVYALPAGSRVIDAILAAGGFTHNADQQALNTAEKIMDGQFIQIPSDPSLDVEQNTLNDLTPTNPENIIDINKATKVELQSLTGINEVLAQRIIDYRSTNGPYKNLEDILMVEGVSAEIFERLKDQISVGAIQ